MTLANMAGTNPLNFARCVSIQREYERGWLNGVWAV
jgi:hypothetical protein